MGVSVAFVVVETSFKASGFNTDPSVYFCGELVLLIMKN